MIKWYILQKKWKVALYKENILVSVTTPKYALLIARMLSSLLWNRLLFIAGTVVNKARLRKSCKRQDT